jgi:hypothetical protein
MYFCKPCAWQGEWAKRAIVNVTWHTISNSALPYIAVAVLVGGRVTVWGCQRCLLVVSEHPSSKLVPDRVGHVRQDELQLLLNLQQLQNFTQETTSSGTTVP